jgi:hypothetical protein
MTVPHELRSKPLHRGPLLASVLASAVLVSTAGCGSTTTDAPGSSGSAGSNPSAGQGGTSTAGGAANSGGSATGGTDTGGTSGGSDATGGNDASGGSTAGDGGSNASGGTSAGEGGSSAGGSGGSGPVGAVGTLGQPCSPPAALACAGNYQKVTLICGGDGTWERNETCGADQFCDSTPGVNVGTCRPRTPGCDAPSIGFCKNASTRVDCGPDAVLATVQCRIFAPRVDGHALYFLTDDHGAPARTVLIEEVDDGVTCP